MTVVPVPETAMGKQHRAISRKDQIGLARQTAIMKTEPEPRSMQSASKNHLRLGVGAPRSEEHTSELQSLMRISYAVFCFKKKNNTSTNHTRIFNSTYNITICYFIDI